MNSYLLGSRLTLRKSCSACPPQVSFAVAGFNSSVKQENVRRVSVPCRPGGGQSNKEVSNHRFDLPCTSSSASFSINFSGQTLIKTPCALETIKATYCPSKTPLLHIRQPQINYTTIIPRLFSTLMLLSTLILFGAVLVMYYKLDTTTVANLVDMVRKTILHTSGIIRLVHYVGLILTHPA